MIKYLLNESSLARSNKPIIWIHLEFIKTRVYGLVLFKKQL